MEYYSDTLLSLRGFEAEMAMRVADKVVLITGGAGGLGTVTAKKLAKEGGKIIVSDLADAAGEVLASEIGGEYFHLDVTDWNAWQAMVADIVARHGRIDVLVHFAGTEGRSRSGLDTTLEAWDMMLKINLTGSFLACKAVVPEMLKQGTGSVILLSSAIAFKSATTALPYGVSKAGVRHLAMTVAGIGCESGKRVRCNSIFPGVMKGRMSDNVLRQKRGDMSEGEADRLWSQGIPFGKRGEPEDIGNLVTYLASDESGYVTGSEFRVDGGWLLNFL